MPDIRGLSKERAAAYLDMKPSGFDRLVREGIIPGPIPGTRRWDKRAIDAALDKRSGLAATLSGSDPFEEWKRGRKNADAH
jgi:hypothetical protein